MTKTELKEYMKINVELKRLEEKITELRNMIESPGSPVLSGMPRGGVGKDISDYICKLTQLQDLYNTRWDKLIDERIRIEEAIDTLSDPVERALMGYKYIDGLTWEALAEKMTISDRHAKRIHEYALLKIEEK